ncbi:insulinase family protein [Roseateles chitinivorans]|uniref:insulinase family protein n=1 Tax=Roseateles chitinivorans TaxID=2917965 RepID=UPI003D678D8A
MVAEPRELRESRRPQSQTLKLSLARAPLPAAALVWQVPRADDPSTPMWQLAQALLGLGRSGRLTDTLVDEKALAHQLSLRLDAHRDAGLLVAQALAAHGQTAAPVAQALQQEVLRLADEPVTDEELNKAKALLRRETLSADWTADRLARSLGTAWAVRGDAGAPAKDMAVWIKLSGAEVQQFWRKQVVQAPVLTLLADIGAAAGVAA